MKAVFVMPVHDPGGTMLTSLANAWQILEICASKVFLGVTETTCQCCPDAIKRIEEDTFITLHVLPSGAQIGDQFRSLYQRATSSTPAPQQLHLCFTDRVLLAISRHPEQFLRDIEAATDQPAPVLFARSERAWATHPKTYRAIEGFATSLGELLLGSRLEYAWCHLAIQCGRMAEIVETLQNHDLSILAEVMLAIHEEVHVREVDWLEWEGPFIMGTNKEDPSQLPSTVAMEAEKRLSYVVPMMQMLVRAALGTK